jgi:O-antigen/teichoic acid export membrane protein
LARFLPHAGLMLLLAGLAFSAAAAVTALLWIQVAAFAVPALVLAWVALSPELRKRPDWGLTGRLLCDRWRNPLLFAPSEIASTAAWNLPVVLIARNFGEAMAAQYGVMLRYAMAPVGLVNSVVGNVYHADLAKGVRSQDTAQYARFCGFRKRMFIIGLAMGLAVALLLPPVLRLLLGPGWETAEQLAMLFAPLVAVAVWISPFGVAFYVFERSWELLLLNLAYVVIAVAAFGLVSGNLRIAAAIFVALAITRFVIMLFRVGQMMRSGMVA